MLVIQIRRTTDGDVLEFTDGATVGRIGFRAGKFTFTHPLNNVQTERMWSDGTTEFRTQVRGGYLNTDQALTSVGFGGTEAAGDWKRVSRQKIST